MLINEKRQLGFDSEKEKRFHGNPKEDYFSS